MIGIANSRKLLLPPEGVVVATVAVAVAVAGVRVGSELMSGHELNDEKPDSLPT